MPIKQQTCSLCRAPRLVRVWVFLSLWAWVWQPDLQAQHPSADALMDATVSNRLLAGPEGLLHEEVIQCLTDENGYHWLVSPSGLQRFDGRSVHFISNIALGYPAKGTQLHLFKDKDGCMWVASLAFVDGHNNLASTPFSSIKQFDPPSMRAVPFHFDAGASTNEYYLPIQDGNRLFLLRGGNQVLELTEHGIQSLFQWPNSIKVEQLHWSERQRTFYGLSAGQLYRYAPASGRVERLPIGGWVSAFYESGAHLFLLFSENATTSFHSSMAAFDPLSRQTSPLLDAQGELLHYIMHSPVGEICFRKGGMLHFFNSRTTGVERSYTIPIDAIIADDEHLNRAAFVDGRYWLLTHRGARVVEFRPKYFNTVIKGTATPISIRSVLPIGADTLLVSAYSGSFLYRLSTGATAPLFPFSKDHGIGYVLTRSGEMVCSGTHAQQLHTYSLADGGANVHKYRLGTSEAGNSFLIPFFDKRQRMWIGMTRGLGYMDDRGEVRALPANKLGGLARSEVRAVTPLPDSLHYWIAATSGAYLFSADAGMVVDSLVHFIGRDISYIACLDANEIWVLPAEDDAYCWHPTTQRMDTLDLYREAWRNSLHALIVDAFGKYWVPSNNGLIRYDPTNRVFTRYTQEMDGLPFNEFNRLAWAWASDSSLYLGGTNGLVRLAPRDFLVRPSDLASPAPVWVTNLQANIANEWVDYTPRIPAQVGQPIPLPADVKGITITFSDLNPLRLDYVYYYRESGHTEWQPLADGVLAFQGMKPGLHTFELGVQRSRSMQFSATTVALYIAYPWYLRGWVIACLSVLVVMAVWWLVRLRLQFLETEKRRLELVIRRRTATIERDRDTIVQQNEQLKALVQVRDKLFALLGHELHRPLLGISNLSGKAAFLIRHQYLKELEGVSQQLDSFAWNTRVLLDNLLNWGQVMLGLKRSQIQAIPLHQLATEVLESFEAMYSSKKLHVVNTIPEAATVDFDRDALFLIFRNLVHNAIKFSHPGKSITLSLEQSATGTQSIAVADQGVGMPAVGHPIAEPAENKSTDGTGGEKGFGLGLYLCDTLAKANGATLALGSNIPCGTVARLVF